jgi:putative spermidine/putrescine transport system substrate-binding protein
METLVALISGPNDAPFEGRVGSTTPGTTLALCFAVVLSAIAGMASVAHAEDSITIASAGGAYQDALREAAWKPVSQKLGIKINEDSSTGQITEVRVQVKSGSPQWNIDELNIDQCAIGAKEGLFEPLDYKILNKEGFPPGMAEPTYIAQNLYSFVIGWNAKKFGQNGPQTWTDVWDVKKFPGKRSLYNYPPQSMEAALLADGVPPDKLYPLDIKRAVASLEKIKPYVAAWWSSGAQSAQLLKDGEVDVIGIWNGRVAAIMKEGAPAAFTFNQGILIADCLAMPKGQTPEKKLLAMKVLAEIVSPDIMANLPKYIDYGPANPRAYDTGKITPEMMKTLNTSPENLKKQVLLNGDWWGEHGGEAQEAWNNFMAK